MTDSKTSTIQPAEKNLRLPLAACALFCCFLWGSAPPFIKWGYEVLSISETPDILLFAGIRFFLAGVLVLLAGIFLKGKQILHPERSAWSKILILALFQTFGQYFFYYMGLAHASSVMGSILSSCSAFFALFLSAWVWHLEDMTFYKGLGAALGLSGIVLLNMKGLSFTFSFNGEGMLLLSQLCSAQSAVFIGIFSKKHDPFLLSGWQFLFGGAGLTALALIFGGHINWNFNGLLILLWLALVSAGAYTLWGLLLKQYPVSSVGIFSSTIPLFGILFSVILLHEMNDVTWNALAALVLICAGVICMNRKIQSPESGK